MNWQYQAQNNAYEAQRERQNTSRANNRARNARHVANQLTDDINQANRTIKKLASQVKGEQENTEYYKNFALEKLNDIKELSQRSAEPGNENLRELSFKHYLIELAGSDPIFGWRGKIGYTWLQSLQQGHNRGPDHGIGEPLTLGEKREINLKLDGAFGVLHLL